MSTSKHPKGKSPFTDDLKRNPGIGQSKGSFATGIQPEEIEGENTVEGDVDNDSTVTDGVPERETDDGGVIEGVNERLGVAAGKSLFDSARQGFSVRLGDRHGRPADRAEQ